MLQFRSRRCVARDRALSLSSSLTSTNRSRSRSHKLQCCYIPDLPIHLTTLLTVPSCPHPQPVSLARPGAPTPPLTSSPKNACLASPTNSPTSTTPVRTFSSRCSVPGSLISSVERRGESASRTAGPVSRGGAYRAGRWRRGRGCRCRSRRVRPWLDCPCGAWRWRCRI